MKRRLALKETCFSEHGLSDVEDVAEVHRFLLIPREKKTSTDFFLLSREIYEEQDFDM